MKRIGDDGAITSVVAAYSPAHVSRLAWASSAEAVRAAALATTDSVPAALKVLAVLAGFAAWIDQEGYSVSVDCLGDPTLIERYVSSLADQVPDSTRATRRAVLRRVARRLDPNPPSAPESIAYRRVKPPYAVWEIARYLSAAEAQPTAARRWSARAVLALGLGCGLDRVDLAWVRGTDVSAGRAGVKVSVAGGPRPRQIVALNDYADLLRECAQTAGKRLLIGGARLGRHNVSTPALDRLADDRTIPRLVPARLRSTWLVHHLNLATPLPVLLPAAGLKSSRSLDDLLEYARPIPEQDRERMLRGAAS
jgi:hypothetical protein